MTRVSPSAHTRATARAHTHSLTHSLTQAPTRNRILIESTVGVVVEIMGKSYLRYVRETVLCSRKLLLGGIHAASPHIYNQNSTTYFTTCITATTRTDICNMQLPHSVHTHSHTPTQGLLGLRFDRKMKCQRAGEVAGAETLPAE